MVPERLMSTLLCCVRMFILQRFLPKFFTELQDAVSKGPSGDVWAGVGRLVVGDNMWQGSVAYLVNEIEFLEFCACNWKTVMTNWACHGCIRQ